MTAAVVPHPAARFTKADAVAWLLGDSCEGCGTRLPAPGHPCGTCGKIPAVTAPELEGQLDSPRALLAVETARLRAEAGALREQALRLHREADRRILLLGLTEIRDEAQAALDAETAKRPALDAGLAKAERAEARAAGKLARASAEHAEIAAAEELARRMQHGVRAEAEAALLLDKATGRLRPRQDKMAAATAAREAAEQDLAAHEARVGELEQARDTAAAVCDAPPRIPYSLDTIAADPVHLAMTGVLDDVEMAMAAFAARGLALVTGADEAIADDAKRELLAQQERDAPHQKAVWTRTDGRGSMTALANPGGHPDVPAQADPPGPNAGQGFNPPMFPRLGY